MDELSDFDRTTATFDDKTKIVYRAGSGPAVIVISEMPGITPDVADFARRVVARGCTVAMPSLFGTDGKPQTGPYLASSLIKGCVSREFHAFAVGKTSPVIVWLRKLAKSLHDECGGPGVGAVGMCFTGGFALAMMVDETVVAPVLSQPSLPLAIGAKRSADLGVSADDLRLVRERVTAGCPVLGLRFSEDSAVGTRFDTLRRELGDGFIAAEIDSSPGNSYQVPKDSHSVLTRLLVDEPGHPTMAALDQVLDFFAKRLAL